MTTSASTQCQKLSYVRSASGISRVIFVLKGFILWELEEVARPHATTLTASIAVQEKVRRAKT